MHSFLDTREKKVSFFTFVCDFSPKNLRQGERRQNLQRVWPVGVMDEGEELGLPKATVIKVAAEFLPQGVKVGVQLSFAPRCTTIECVVVVGVVLEDLVCLPALTRATICLPLITLFADVARCSGSRRTVLQW